MAILREVTAPKPGNVYRGADFEDMSYDDLIAGGIAIASAIDRAGEAPVGQTILAAIRQTQALVGKNTNLGTVLLIAPLAKAAAPLIQRDDLSASAWQDELGRILDSLDANDAELAYAAIRLANPGGLGRAPEHDVADAPPEDLLTAMKSAANRDLVAAQFANGFEQVFGFVLPKLRESNGVNCDPAVRDQHIVNTFLELLAEFPDSLIARKCGADVAKQASDRAAEVLRSGLAESSAFQTAIAEFDFWLRSDGHRRNPGTSADLIAAGLFCHTLLCDRE